MKATIYTLGCKVNLYESEVVMKLFKDNGYEIVDFSDDSDIYVINTCTVTNSSDAKSRKIIRHVANNHPNSIIVVMGCYSQIKPNEVSNISGVDIIIGNKDKSRIIDIINEYKEKKNKINRVSDIKKIEFEPMELNSFETRTRAFVKIQDGCNNYCSYCIIPYARGNIRSKEMNDVLKEVNTLVSKGYVELVLAGIHSGHYGKDKHDYDFSDLLNELYKINDLKRIRISSIEITELDDKFLNTLKSNSKIVDHIHIPLQSGCDKTLKEMNRKYDTKYFLNKIEEIRVIRPDISITTDVIVGFPNETDEDFSNTVKFIKKVNFSKIHVFPFSKREGTPAATMPNQIDNETKKKRVNILLTLSKELEINYMNRFIDKELEIIPEKLENGYLVGHASNYIMIKCIGSEDELGKLKTIKITDINYPYMIAK
jgi:threonylcarbamoyladenosine tRNA methylthiotransferase MtaB